MKLNENLILSLADKEEVSEQLAYLTEKTADKTMNILDIDFVLSYINMHPIIVIDIFEQVSGKKFTDNCGSLPKNFRITTTGIGCLCKKNINHLYFEIDNDGDITELYIPRSYDEIILKRIKTYMRLNKKVICENI